MKFAYASIAILFFTVCVTSCGNKSTTDAAVSISGPVLTGSKNSGAYLAMVSPDSNVSATSLYYYNFGTGGISQVTSSEGRDPVALWNTAKKSVIFIVRSTKVFRVFSLESGNPVDGKSGTFSELTTGDPSAWVDTGSGNYLLASLHDRSLRSFESTSGYLSGKIELSTADLSASGSQISPYTLAKSGTAYWLTASGINFSGVSPSTVGTATALKLTSASDTWSVSDLNNSTSGIQGTTLTASHPTFAQPTAAGAGVRYFGLCKSDYGASCKSGSDEVHGTSGVKTALNSFTNAAYEYFSWTVPGASDDEVYAHVTNKTSAQQMIVRVNLATGAFKEILTLPDSSLSLLMYDKDADRLLIGTKEGGLGILNVYKAEQFESKVTTKDLPYQGSFVPTL